MCARNARRSYLNIKDFLRLLAICVFFFVVGKKWNYLNGAFAVGFTLLPYGVHFNCTAKEYLSTNFPIPYCEIQARKDWSSWISRRSRKKGSVFVWGIFPILQTIQFDALSSKLDEDVREWPVPKVKLKESRKSKWKPGVEERRFESKHVDWLHFGWLWWRERGSWEEASFFAARPARSISHSWARMSLRKWRTKTLMIAITRHAIGPTVTRGMDAVRSGRRRLRVACAISVI